MSSNDEVESVNHFIRTERFLPLTEFILYV